MTLFGRGIGGVPVQRPRQCSRAALFERSRDSTSIDAQLAVHDVYATVGYQQVRCVNVITDLTVFDGKARAT